MPTIVDEAVSAIQNLPPARREALARLVLRLANQQDEPPEDIDPAHLHAVLEGLAQIKRRDFATEEEVAAAYARFDR